MYRVVRYFLLACMPPVALCVTDPLRAGSAAEGLSGRVILGYQGWFGCPGDYAGNQRWQHWVIQNEDTHGPAPTNIRVDLLPALAGIPEKELCRTELRTADGAPVWLFSSQNEQIVLAHFRWMAKYQ